MKATQFLVSLVSAATVLVSGCATTSPRVDAWPSNNCSSSYGLVESIESVRRNDDGVGVGAVIGGIVGGVLGHQVRGGRGKDVATVADVVGGAVVGNRSEKNNKSGDVFRIHTRKDNGDYQTITQDSVGELRVGDRARIEGDRVYAPSENNRYDSRGNRY